MTIVIPEVIPDAIEPVEAWRSWDFRDGKLWSMNSGGAAPTVWTPGEPLAADCGLGGRHRAPDEGCRCGIYAAHDRAGAYTGNVLGKVKLWGKIVPAERGYRAQLAYPSELRVRSELAREPGLLAFGVPIAIDDSAPRTTFPQPTTSCFKLIAQLATPLFDWQTDEINLAFAGEKYSPRPEDGFFDSVRDEIPGGGGYARGGLPLTGRRIVENNHETRFVADDVLLSAFAPRKPVRYAVIYRAAAHARERILIALIDFGAALDPRGAMFRISWPQSGVFYASMW